MEEKVKKTDVYIVPFSFIKIEKGFNIREDLGDLEELMQSIVEIGLQDPLHARKIRGTDNFLLVDGHRRYFAIKMAIERGHVIKNVKVIPYQGTDDDATIMMLASGVSKKQLHLVEQASGVKRLADVGYDAGEIASKIGLNVGRVRQLLTLSSASNEVKQMLMKDLVSFPLVLQVIKQHPDDTDAQFDALTSSLKEANPDLDIDSVQNESGNLSSQLESELDETPSIVKKATRKIQKPTFKPIDMLYLLLNTLKERDIHNSKVDLLETTIEEITNSDNIDKLIMIYES